MLNTVHGIMRGDLSSQRPVFDNGWLISVYRKTTKPNKSNTHDYQKNHFSNTLKFHFYFIHKHTDAPMYFRELLFNFTEIFSTKNGRQRETNHDCNRCGIRERVSPKLAASFRKYFTRPLRHFSKILNAGCPVVTFYNCRKQGEKISNEHNITHSRFDFWNHYGFETEFTTRYPIPVTLQPSQKQT